jgi:hypothetical protein
MISFSKFLIEMNVPGTHLDGNTWANAARSGNGALVTSDQSGSEQPETQHGNFLPSLDMVVPQALERMDTALPKTLDRISTNFESGETSIPVHPSLEYVAKVSPKWNSTGIVTYTNGVPLPPSMPPPPNAEAPRSHIHVSFRDPQGKNVNLIMTKPQYHSFKEMNGNKDIQMGMKIAVCMQRALNDSRLLLPWGNKQNNYKTTPNYSNILGVRYWR